MYEDRIDLENNWTTRQVQGAPWAGIYFQTHTSKRYYKLESYVSSTNFLNFHLILPNPFKRAIMATFNLKTKVEFNVKLISKTVWMS